MAENNVPLGAYIDPLLRVNWMGRYIAIHEGYFTLTRRAVLTYVALIMLGLVLSMIPGLRHLNWIIGLAVQIVGLVGLFMPGNIIASWVLGFAAGQPGGEKGLDIADGTQKGKEFLEKYVRFVGYVIFFGGLPFMGLGLFHTWSNPVGALIVLTLSVSLTIGGIMLFESARAFMKLVWLIYLFIVLWILAGFIPGLKEMQEKVTSVGDGFIATRIVDNPADIAKKKAEGRQRELRIKAAKDCFDALPATPTPEAKAKCEALHLAIDRPLFGGAGENFSAVSEKLAPGFEQAKGAVEDLKKWVNSFTTGSDGSCLTYFTGVYVPSVAKGRMPLGDQPFCAGNYRYEVAGRGIHQQGFSDLKYGRYSRLVDCDGNNPNGSGTLFEVPDQWEGVVPLGKKVPYGTCFIGTEKDGSRVFPVAIGSGMEFALSAPTPLFLDKNVQGTEVAYSGPGEIRIRIVPR